MAHLTTAADNTAEATQGEQLLIEPFQSALASDQEGQIVAGLALTELHPDSPRAWVFLGNFYGNVNNSADARAAYGKSMSLDPAFMPAHIQLGNSYMFQEPKDYGEAEEQFRKAVELAPNEPNPHDFLGDVHRAQGKFEAAYDDYTRAAELAPELGSAIQQRGHVNSFLGNYDEARADYTRSAELEQARGSNAGPFFLVFRAYVSLHEGDYDAAMTELRELAETAGSSDMEGMMDLRINALTNVAQIATHAGNADKATNAIDEVAALMRQQASEVGNEEFTDAQEATISYMQGMLAARMGDTEGAAASASEYEANVASSNNPRKMERMHEISGMTAYYQDDFAAAAEHLSAGDPLNNMYTKYHLALANEATGNSEEAQRLLEELGVWNFNGPQYALIRGDVVARLSKE